MEVVILGLAAVVCFGCAEGGELAGVSTSEFDWLRGLAYLDLGTKLCLEPIFNDSVAISASLMLLQ